MLYGLRGWIGKLLPRGPFYCNLCGYKGSVWLWRGHENEATRNYDIIGAGRRKCDCFACGSSDRDRSVFHFLIIEKSLLLLIFVFLPIFVDDIFYLNFYV